MQSPYVFLILRDVSSHRSDTTVYPLPSSQGCTLHDLAGLDHTGDVLGMLQDTDVVERGALDQDEVSPLARCERPGARLNADGLSRHPRGDHEGFRRREAILREMTSARILINSRTARLASAGPLISPSRWTCTSGR